MSWERYLSKTYDESKKALRVSPIGSLLSSIDFDKVTATYPTTTTELFDYTLMGVTVAQILVTYTDASKSDLSSAERL
jgi:hypothetical protein